MTVKEKTICNMIQAFPVMLILAQNHEKCLDTPFSYHPPQPTHSTEYYEALEALVQTLYHQKPDSHPTYDCDTYQQYGKGYYGPTHKPCYGYEHHGHEYPSYTAPYPTSGYPHYKPGYQHNYPHKYPNPNEGTLYGITGYNGHNGYNFKKGVYNRTSGQKGYAPTQVYTGTPKIKVKVVVKKNKISGMKRGAAAKIQGFFPQDGSRFRIQRPRQQMMPNVRRLLSHLSHLYPFNGARHFDQYGRTYYDTNKYEQNDDSNTYDPNYDNIKYDPNHDSYKYGPNYVSFPEPSPNYNVPNGFYVDNGERPNYENPNNPLLVMEIEKRPSFDEEPPASTLFIETAVKMPVETPTEPPKVEDTLDPIIILDEGRNTDSNVGTADRFSSDVSEQKDSFVIWPADKEKEKENLEVMKGRDDLIAIPSETPEALPALTPAPARINYNFGSEGIFNPLCTTPAGGTGTCQLVAQCPPLLARVRMVQSGQLRKQDVWDELRKAHCGFEGNDPKVCCPLDGIPTNMPTNTLPTALPASLPTVPPTPAPTTTTTTTTTTTEAPANRQPKFDEEVFPQPPVCGVSNASNFRVVGGQNASLGDFPWMALLGYRRARGDGTRWQCGGALVSSRHVLTAAHCIHGHENDLYVVRLGELDLGSDDDGAAPVDILIREKIPHKDYSPNNYANDVGILLLDQPVAFSDLILPICLPQNPELRGRNFENYQPFVAGWGYINFRGPSSNRLQYVQLPVTSQEACAASYARYRSQVIDERVLCAGYTNGGKDACKGDSGGPLMQPIWNPVTSRSFVYAIGVVSYGKGCAEKNAPGVYTRVGEFMPWITNVMLATS